MNFWRKIGKILRKKSPEDDSCQKIPFKKSKEPEAQLVDPKSIRGLRFKTALASFFERISGGTQLCHDPIKRYVHIAAKGDKTLPENIRKGYGTAQDPDESHRLRFADAENYMRAKGAIIDDGLRRIVKNRKIVMDFNHILYEMRDTDKGVKKIFQCIQNLKDPDSQRVIQLEDGSTTFCVPGGNHKNPVCYEFKRDKDRYFFIVHNRFYDQKVTDETLCSGIENIRFEYNGKEFGKTSIRIQFPNTNKMQDRDFLMALFGAEKTGNTQQACKVICKYLLHGENPGIIVISDEEKKLKNCLRNPDPSAIEELKRAVIEKDPSFNSLEIFESSSESNFTPPERTMACDKTRNALRQHTIQCIVEQIIDNTFLHQKAKDAETIIQHHQKRCRNPEEKNIDL